MAESLKYKRNFHVPISYLLEMKNSKSFQANIAVPQIYHTHVALGSYNPCETFVLVRPCGLLITTYMRSYMLDKIISFLLIATLLFWITFLSNMIGTPSK